MNEEEAFQIATLSDERRPTSVGAEATPTG